LALEKIKGKSEYYGGGILVYCVVVVLPWWWWNASVKSCFMHENKLYFGDQKQRRKGAINCCASTTAL
jgi:hypothetical protein